MRSVVIVPTAVISLLALAGCERWALDRQMEELCKKDGGVKIYETVRLPASEYEALWTYKVTAKAGEDYYGPNYRWVATREILVGKNADTQKGEGQLARLHWAIYRRSDGRLLGEQVEYRRNGGDLFTFGFQPSNTSCPRVERGVAQSVFIKGD